jgi:biopolymer transport protein TolQ
MEITQDLSFIHLIINASILVQIVMGLLLLVSLMSWWHIFMKMFAIRSEVRLTREFEEEFWSSQNLNELYKQINGNSLREHGALEIIFSAGFAEFVKLKEQRGVDAGALMEGTRRAMRATFQREMDRLESNLAFLASVGSISPYVGLFGTVWGIMNAFQGLSVAGQATLAQVAPGIAEALVATAMGLFAAIPAVAAYNRYAYEINRLSSRFDSFTEEFSNVLQRQP